jgi:hypothetical protein
MTTAFFDRALTRIGLALLAAFAASATPAHADPMLAYATYLGGTDDDADVVDTALVDVAVDLDGNVYLAANTRSVDFPGGQGVYYGGVDIVVTKLSPSGSLLYTKRLGGPCDDAVRDLAVDTAGDAYVTGRINGGICELQGGAYVAKLDPDGGLIFHTRLGGSAGDESIGTGIAVGPSGVMYLTGVAQSVSHDFPVIPDTFRTEDCGGADADVYVARLAKGGSTLLYSGFLCGTGDDESAGIAFDADGFAYVAGSTTSTDFTTAYALQDAPRGAPGAVTGFVAKVSPLGQTLMWSTYLGGSGNDVIHGMTIDAQQNVYVTGETQSVDYPTTIGALQERAGTRDCGNWVCTDAFVTKLDASGSALAYSTYLYGEADDAGRAIAVDAGGNAVVAGTSTSTLFPVRRAFQDKAYGLADAFVAQLAPDGGRLAWSSFLGGADSGTSSFWGWDAGTGLALAPTGDVYVSGYTMSYDFPVTQDALQAAIGAGLCDAEATPCADAFVVRVTSGGPALLPAVNVTVTPDDVVAGDTITATWAGLPAPVPGDRLQLQPLGAPVGDFGEGVASWPTTGAAAGTQAVPLPRSLERGTYELRLLGTDPRHAETAIMARSAPIRVADAPPPPPPSNVCAAGCDDGDPCTDDACVAGTCRSTPVGGQASVTCTCGRAQPAACAGVPPAIARRKARVCDVVAGGSAKRLRASVRKLAAAVGVVTRLRRKGRLSASCADELTVDLRDARDRAARLLGHGR